MNAEFVKATAAPAVQKMWAKFTMEPVGSTSAELIEALGNARGTGERVFKALDIRASAVPSSN